MIYNCYGNYSLHPTPIRFTSPLTGPTYTVNYSRSAFETDLPLIENPNVCNINTGAGCTLIPLTDDNTSAVFYPFYSIINTKAGCVWRLGNHLPQSANDFGQNAQYGTLLGLAFTGLGGSPTTIFPDFRQILSKNPCTTNQ